MAAAVRENGLDKFYTVSSIAEKCIASVGFLYNWNSWDLVIEPSAGNGSFLHKIPTLKRIGIDIAPEHSDIVQQDYLTYVPPNVKNILVIGNPPFGKISSLAIKFFNHAAEKAYVIAFIVPRTFRRISVQNKLDLHFHLVHDEDIPTHSFSPPMNAKCCFQIWVRRDVPRVPVELSTTHEDWKFLAFGVLEEGQPSVPIGADFALRAYGGKCGEIVTEIAALRPKSWHWIKSNISVSLLMTRFAFLDYSLSKDTARQNSIGRGELVKLYSEKYD